MPNYGIPLGIGHCRLIGHCGLVIGHSLVIGAWSLDIALTKGGPEWL
jgi:hypothetical protein